MILAKKEELCSVKTLISIVGPTGIGKTRLSLDLAKHFSTEIISCDSRQLYREMPIGTAAPTVEELQEVPHHFIGNRSVRDLYSIGQYETEALELLHTLFQKYETVVLVGGSMMYEKAVIEGLHDLPPADKEHQEKLQQIWDQEGIAVLQNILAELDPEYAAQVDLQNPRRLFRAIDIIWQTGRTYSELIRTKKDKRDFRVIRIGVDAPREVIYDRINRRVEVMLEQGLLKEAKQLEPVQHLPALQTVGYAELFRYFNEEISLAEAIEDIKRNSRRFAKRQLTWYRGEKNIHWVSYCYSTQESLSLLRNLLNQ